MALWVRLLATCQSYVGVFEDGLGYLNTVAGRLEAPTRT
jgi:hypothetical protein